MANGVVSENINYIIDAEHREDCIDLICASFIFFFGPLTTSQPDISLQSKTLQELSCNVLDLVCSLYLS